MSKNNLYANKSIENIKNSEEYRQNQMQIDVISKTLIEHADVPPKLIDWLIEAVQKNIVLEYECLKKYHLN